MAKRKNTGSSLQGQALKDFRHQVAILKKKGLVSKKTDARKQRATRYMKAKVKALAPVLEGWQTGVRVSPEIARRYKEGGFQVVNRRVIVSKDKDEIAIARKGELIRLQKMQRDYPYEKVVMPARINSIEAFIAEASKSPPDSLTIFGGSLNPGDAWAFTFFGRNSLATFADLGLLAEYLSNYQTILNATKAEDKTEIFQNFVLYRTRPEFWQPSPRTRRKRAKTVQDRRLAGGVRGRTQMQQRTETLAQQNARHQRAWYERHKEKMKAEPAYAEKVRQEKAKRQRDARAARKARENK